jgi:uncharacterized protein (TIGR02646 family)
MRYIQKREAPQYLIQWKVARAAAGQNLAYEHFDFKRQLNQDLREDQHHICCYCQQIITHFQGKKEGGSHNEHLVPENGPFGNYDLQVDYNNLFACCNITVGMGKKEKLRRHCGDAKGDLLIRGFIQEQTCTNSFKYNNLGEILPNGSYPSFKEYQANRNALSKDESEALNTLEVLNLNSVTLVNDRKKDFDKLFKVMVRLNKQIIDQKIIDFQQLTHFPRYIDMLLYYMRKKK